MPTATTCRVRRQIVDGKRPRPETAAFGNVATNYEIQSAESEIATNNLTTITTPAAHNFVIGQQITISGQCSERRGVTTARSRLSPAFRAPRRLRSTIRRPTRRLAGTSRFGAVAARRPALRRMWRGPWARVRCRFNGGVVTGGGAGASVNGAEVTGFVDAPGFSLPAGSPVTVSFWFQIPQAFSTATTTSMRPQFNFGVGASQATNGQALNRFSCNTPWTDGNTYFDYGGQTNFQDRAQITWQRQQRVQHLAATRGFTACMVAGGSTSPYRAIYMNGQLYAMHYFGSAGPQVTLQRLMLGCSPESLGFNMFQGLMDDFRIYNRVLGLE